MSEDIKHLLTPPAGCILGFKDRFPKYKHFRKMLQKHILSPLIGEIKLSPAAALPEGLAPAAPGQQIGAALGSNHKGVSEPAEGIVPAGRVCISHGHLPQATYRLLPCGLQHCSGYRRWPKLWSCLSIPPSSTSEHPSSILWHTQDALQESCNPPQCLLPQESPSSRRETFGFFI